MSLTRYGLAALLTPLSFGAAHAADIAYEPAPYAVTAAPPPPVIVQRDHLASCDSPDIYRRIAGRFASRDGTYWHTGLRITGFTQPRELGYRPWGPDFVPRRFCSALALTNEGAMRPVYYSIAEELGVTWCVSGTDWNYAYAPDCKMARP